MLCFYAFFGGGSLQVLPQDKEKRIHLVGIGGASMSGLAKVLFGRGYTITGSDSADSATLRQLAALGMDVRAGHHPHMVDGASRLVYSAAISQDDPERIRASALGIPQISRAQLLGALMQAFEQQICVCGTHGKTSTTAMLAQIMLQTGADPSIHLGGNLDSIGGSVRDGQSSLYIAEACEFNRSFLQMPVTFAVLLNIEEDHLDCYGTMEKVEEAYLDFLSQLPDEGTVLYLGSDERAIRVVSKLPGNRQVYTFGNAPHMDYSFANLAYDDKGLASFDVMKKDEKLGHVKMSVPGFYNALHGLTALAAAHLLGAPMEEACQSLASFHGAHRRFEWTGSVQGMDLYHDYGHNPAEMRAAIDMAVLQKRRVIAVMQPHTYSRVKSLFEDYLTSTKQADITLVTEIFAAREADPGDIDSHMLIEGMLEKGIQAYSTPGFDDVEDWLLRHGRAGDLVLTMGCGNINLLNEQMNQNEAKRQARGGVQDEE